MMKILFIVIDGLGDEKIPQLKNKTPLEAAKTPHLDLLAKKGICGLMKPFKFPWQEKPESDTSHLALFGYDPKKYYLGRGPYEAAGAGIELKKGDIALRANFATVDNHMRVIDRRAGRIEDTQSLISALSGREIEGVKFILKKCYGHRAVLVLTPSSSFLTSGKRENILSYKITDNDPKKVGFPIKEIKAKIKKAQFTARVLNQFLKIAHSILKNHPQNKERERKGLLPANCLLVRGAGCFKETPSFKEKYNLNACCIAGGNLYKGIAKILGMDLIKVKGATGLPNTNLKGKIFSAKNALKKYDFVFLHIKATDSLAEDGNFLGKKEFIEKIDKNLKPLLNLKEVLILITSDHSTCSLLKRHCLKPIPILIVAPKIKPDKIEKFCERTCEKGSLGKFEQLDLMPKLFKIQSGKF